MASGAPLDLAGRLVQGTCGWGSPHQHLSVYPASCRSAEDRLEVYSRHFGAVEVDSTCYAIPSAKVVERWVKRVPPGFTFLFKAFGAFCASSVDVASLPRSTRALLGPEDDGKSHVAYARLPEEARADLWNAFHACLAPVSKANKLACVVFQFHTTFGVSPSNRAKVEELRTRLDPKLQMAVEFRDRAWIVGAVGDETARWCSRMDLALVASDELAHETAQPDRAQTGLPKGHKRIVMPTKLVASATWGALIRVHRRHGGKERVLTPSEIVCWGARINAILPELRKRVYENEETKSGPPVGSGSPLYVMWGTDWKDAPLLNAAALANAVPAAARLDWAAEQKKKARAKKNGVAGLFARRAQMANGEEGVREGFGLESRRCETVTRKTDDERARDEKKEGAVFANGKAREQKANEDAAPATTKKRFLGEETRSPFPGGAGDDSSRLGSGCAPVAKRAKNSAIARMFAKCASPDGKR
jgi:uncharacterized protein YecE (DUF72 family)